MDLAQALAAALLLLPHPWANVDRPNVEETPAEYAARVTMIAEEQVAAALELTPEPEQALLLATAAATQFYAESGAFRLDVHRGLRRGDHGRALGLPQVHRLRAQSRDEYEAMAGDTREHTARQLRMGTRLLAGAIGSCRRKGDPAETVIARGMARYGSGASCLPGAREWGRARRWAALVARVRLGFSSGSF